MFNSFQVMMSILEARSLPRCRDVLMVYHVKRQQMPTPAMFCCHNSSNFISSSFTATWCFKKCWFINSASVYVYIHQFSYHPTDPSTSCSIKDHIYKPNKGITLTCRNRSFDKWAIYLTAKINFETNGWAKSQKLVLVTVDNVYYYSFAIIQKSFIHWNSIIAKIKVM